MSDQVNSLSNYMEEILLKRAAGIDPAVVLYVHLYTGGNPNADGTVTAPVAEVSSTGTNYAKQVVAFDPVTVGATTTTQNTNPVVFGVASAPWGTVTSMAIRDNSGNMYWYGALTASKVVGTDDQLQFIAGAIDLEID